MLSKYGILCEVIAEGSFTKVAEHFGYAQSSISASVKSVEEELSTSLIDRRRHNITWTEDGKAYAPYITAIYAAEQALSRKSKEMQGLSGQVIRIGTFTSVSRDFLPPLMQTFRNAYPGVSFELHQGDYDEIHDWLESGQIDLGFMAEVMAGKLPHDYLYEDRMLAVLPPQHPLAAREMLSLRDLEQEPFILLDEGRYSTILTAFHDEGLSPQIAYRVYDDYSILSMVRSQLGVALLFHNVIRGFDKAVAVRPLKEPVLRRTCLAYRDESTLPYAAARFRKFIRTSPAVSRQEIPRG